MTFEGIKWTEYKIMHTCYKKQIQDHILVPIMLKKINQLSAATTKVGINEPSTILYYDNGNKQNKLCCTCSHKYALHNLSTNNKNENPTKKSINNIDKFLRVFFD